MRESLCGFPSESTVGRFIAGGPEGLLRYNDLLPSVAFESFCAMYIAPTARVIAPTHTTARERPWGLELMLDSNV